MPYNPDKHHRRSIRLKGYDYSQPGSYFITICTQNREHLFGDIINGAMHLNDAGQMIEQWWTQLPHKFPSVQVDTSIVMPNHVHAIIILVGADTEVCPNPFMGMGRQNPNQSMDNDRIPSMGVDFQHANKSNPAIEEEGTLLCVPLPVIVQWFKTMTTNAYIRGVKQCRWQPFPGKLWQRNYYERIVRDAHALYNVRRYIKANPQNWAEDTNNRR